jgi:hypothetical protein
MKYEGENTRVDKVSSKRNHKMLGAKPHRKRQSEHVRRGTKMNHHNCPKMFQENSLLTTHYSLLSQQNKIPTTKEKNSTS